MAKPANTPLGTLRAAFESTGSPHWIMYTIQQLGLDRELGFELQIDYLDDQMHGHRHSTEQALVDGQVDFIDSDWITLGRCRHQGLEISAVYPYGTILGGLVVPNDSPINDIRDLQGHRLGVVSELDKNWILTRAVAKQVYQLDLANRVELHQAKSKSTLKQWLEQGQVDAALVYWHQIPYLQQQQQYRLLLDIPALLPELGLRPTPTTFFIFRDRFIEQQPELVQAFIDAFEQAVEQLHHDDQLWHQIATELLHIENPTLLSAVRAIWRSRMPGDWDRASIEQLHGLYRQLEHLEGLHPRGRTLGAGSQLPDGCFNWHFMTGAETAPTAEQQLSQTR